MRNRMTTIYQKRLLTNQLFKNAPVISDGIVNEDYCE